MNPRFSTNRLFDSTLETSVTHGSVYTPMKYRKRAVQSLCSTSWGLEGSKKTSRIGTKLECAFLTFLTLSAHGAKKEICAIKFVFSSPAGKKSLGPQRSRGGISLLQYSFCVPFRFDQDGRAQTSPREDTPQES